MIIGGIRPLSKLIWFTYRIGAILGFSWPIGMWVYMFFSVFCLKTVMPDYRFITREGSRLEAKFKFNVLPFLQTPNPTSFTIFRPVSARDPTQRS